MKCFVLEMKDCGAVEEHADLELPPGHSGILEIFDTCEVSLNRILKLAVLKDAVGNVIKTLYSVSIFCLGDDKLGLTGFERTTNENVLMDVCRRWVLKTESVHAS
ncbi:MAG: hypothetical protein ACRYGK_03360 [Janthinobacterium lividum]